MMIHFNAMFLDNENSDSVQCSRGQQVPDCSFRTSKLNWISANNFYNNSFIANSWSTRAQKWLSI